MLGSAMKGKYTEGLRFYWDLTTENHLVDWSNKFCFLRYHSRSILKILQIFVTDARHPNPSSCRQSVSGRPLCPSLFLAFLPSFLPSFFIVRTPRRRPRFRSFRFPELFSRSSARSRRQTAAAPARPRPAAAGTQ